MTRWFHEHALVDAIVEGIYTSQETPVSDACRTIRLGVVKPTDKWRIRNALSSYTLALTHV